MDAHVRDCLVTDFEGLIGELDLPDPDDRHVLAAAIRGRTDVILTRNLRDFPTEKLQPFGIEAQHPDTFVMHLLDLNPGPVVVAVRDHRVSLKSRPKDVGEYLNTLEKHGLTQTVAELRGFANGL